MRCVCIGIWLHWYMVWYLCPYYMDSTDTDIFNMCLSIGIKFMDSLKYEYDRVVLFQKILTIIQAASGI